MASHIVADCTEDTVTQQSNDVSVNKQMLQEVNDKLVTLSEKVTMCNTVLSDLKELNDALAKKSLQDVSLPSLK